MGVWDWDWDDRCRRCAGMIRWIMLWDEIEKEEKLERPSVTHPAHSACEDWREAELLEIERDQPIDFF